MKNYTTLRVLRTKRAPFLNNDMLRLHSSLISPPTPNLNFARPTTVSFAFSILQLTLFF